MLSDSSSDTSRKLDASLVSPRSRDMLCKYRILPTLDFFFSVVSGDDQSSVRKICRVVERRMWMVFSVSEGCSRDRSREAL